MITFSNAHYIINHGKKPSGLGRWAFYTFISNQALTRENCPLEHYKYGRYSLIWSSDVMLLSDAKKELENWLKSKGYKKELVYVAD